MNIPVNWNTRNKFCVARVHYSCDPDKNTPEWLERAKAGVPERSWNREYEIAYDVFDGQPVYAGFNEVHIQSFEYSREESEYVYRGWDFGRRRPATAFAFINKLNQLCIRKEILGENESIKDFGWRVKNFSMSEFPGAKWLDACDIAGKQLTDTAEFTSIQVLNNDPLNIYPTFRQSKIGYGIEIIAQRLAIRNDGLPGIIIHPDCKIMIDAFKGGYRYAEAKEGSSEKEEPVKDGYYDHLMDAFRYIVVNFLELASSNPAQETGAVNEIMRPQHIDDYQDFFGDF